MARGVGDPTERFLSISQPGGMRIGDTARGGVRIEGELQGGGISRLRIEMDGTVRVDAVPRFGSSITKGTEHWDKACTP